MSERLVLKFDRQLVDAMTSPRSYWFLKGGRSTEEEETSSTVIEGEDDKSSKQVNEEEENSSEEEGNEEEENSSEEEGNEEEENSSEEEGNEKAVEEENSSKEGNEEEVKSPEEGNEEEEKSSQEGNEAKEKSSQKGLYEEEKSSQEGIEEAEKSSEEGNGEEEKSSLEGIEEEEKSSQEGIEEEKSSQEGIEEEKSSQGGIEEEEKSSQEGIEEEEKSLEESEEENLLRHQRNNHVEYFESLRSSVSRMDGVNCQTILQTPPQLVPPSNFKQSRTPSDKNKKVRFVDFAPEEETESTVARKENNNLTVGGKDVSKFNRPSNECKICDKTFANPSNLSRHLRRLHGAKLSTQNSAPNQNVDNGRESSQGIEIDLPPKSSPASKGTIQIRFKCYNCSSTFSRLDNLKTHFTSLHLGSPLKILPKSVPISDQAVKSDKPSSKKPGKVDSGDSGAVYGWKPQEVMVVPNKQLQSSSKGSAVKRPAVVNTNEYARPFKINRMEVSCKKCGDVFPTTRWLSAHLEANPGCDKPGSLPRNSDAVSGYSLGMEGIPVARTSAIKVPFEEKKNTTGSSATKTTEAPKGFRDKSKRPGQKRKSRSEGYAYCEKCESWFGDNEILQRHAERCKSPPDESKCLRPGRGPHEKSTPPVDDVAKTSSDDAEETPSKPEGILSCAIEAGTGSIQSGPTTSSTLEKSDIADSTGVQNQQVEGEVGPEDPRSYRCGKCGRSFGRKTHLQRHMVKKTCYETQAKVLMALNTTLDFICQFCNKDLKHRSWLESHVACCHRLVHENAREYQHLDMKKEKASTIFFCPFCGLQKASRRGMVRHFRANHKELFGVPKKSINNV